MDLRGNRITTFRPNAFHNMEKLVEIHLTSNKMIRLPTNSFYNYPNLKILDIWCEITIYICLYFSLTRNCSLLFFVLKVQHSANSGTICFSCITIA
jgi:hypothetical protein